MMAQALPVTLQEMALVEGVPQSKIDKFGQEFLTLTMNYASLSECTPYLTPHPSVCYFSWNYLFCCF